jgi:hypothetical protein
MRSSRVRFLETQDKVLSRLEIRAVDAPDLVTSLTRALLQMRVQLVRFETRAEDGNILVRLSIVEFDGARIGPARRFEVQNVVLALLEPAAPRRPVRSARAAASGPDRLAAGG